MDGLTDSTDRDEAVVEEDFGAGKIKTANDNVVISLTESHRTRATEVVYSHPFQSDKSEYYEEWLQKCVAWVALCSGIKRMDYHSLEKVTNFLANEIKKIGRKTVYYSTMRGCETSNFVDVMNALESVNPAVYEHIFTDKQMSRTKQMAKPAHIVSHSSLVQPAVLSQPSALYFECMVNATEGLSELNKDESGNSDRVYDSMSVPESKLGKHQRDPESLDMDYFLAYSSRNPYSFKCDEIYQQIVASRPKCLHKHMPLFPPEFMFSEGVEQSFEYSPEPKSQDKGSRQSMLLQSDLPMLHRVQIEPDMQELRSGKKTGYNKD